MPDASTVEHTERCGAAQVLKNCTLPLTGMVVVDVLVTDRADFTIDKRGIGARPTERASGAAAAEPTRSGP